MRRNSVTFRVRNGRKIAIINVAFVSDFFSKKLFTADCIGEPLLAERKPEKCTKTRLGELHFFFLFYLSHAVVLISVQEWRQ
jgi:hypothetical protein